MILEELISNRVYLESYLLIPLRHQNLLLVPDGTILRLILRVVLTPHLEMVSEIQTSKDLDQIYQRNMLQITQMDILIKRKQMALLAR